MPPFTILASLWRLRLVKIVIVLFHLHHALHVVSLIMINLGKVIVYYGYVRGNDLNDLAVVLPGAALTMQIVHHVFV